MDLPTCPTCGQSVLDDDAAECPFCGSPMKGGVATKPAPKPASGTKPAAKPSAATKTPPSETKTAAASPAAKMAAKPAAKPKSDDPFDIEGHTGAGAVPVSPKQMKGRTLEVKCPMCETVGYVPPAAAGKEAKCCNPDCKLPNFHIPAPKKEEAPPPPPPKSSMPLFFGISAAVVLLAVAGGVYMVFFANPKERPVPPPGVDFKPMTLEGDPAEGGPQPAEDGKPKVVEAPVPQDNKKLIAAELDSLIDAVLESRTLKAHGRRLASVAATLAGKDDIAKQQFEQLKKAETSIEDDEIVPLVYMAWSKLAKGDTAGATADMDAAFSRVKHFERLGRYKSEAALHLATLLAANGRTADAWSTLAAGTAGDLQDSLTTAMEAARAQGTFDLDRPQYGRSIGGWDRPQAVGVTLLLCARGKWDEALAWAKSASEAATRGECLSIWGEAYAHPLLAEKNPLTPVSAIYPDLSPGERARLMARVAHQQLNAGDEAAATASLADALKALGEVTPIAQPEFKSLRDLETVALPDPYPMRGAALAAADIGALQAQLKQPDAWKMFERGLEFVRGNAPDLAAAKTLEKRAGNVADVRRDYNDSRDDTARNRIPRLRPLAARVVKAAQARSQREFDLYEAAIDAGLLQDVWTATKASPALLRTGIPGALVMRANDAKQAALAEEITKAVNNNFPRDSLYNREATRVLANLGDQKNIEQGLSLLPPLNRSDEFHEWRVKLVCRAIKDKKLKDAALMLARMSGASGDPFLLADAQRLAASLATLTGQRSAFRNALSTRAPHYLAPVHAGVVDALTLPAGK